MLAGYAGLPSVQIYLCSKSVFIKGSSLVEMQSYKSLLVCWILSSVISSKQLHAYIYDFDTTVGLVFVTTALFLHEVHVFTPSEGMLSSNSHLGFVLQTSFFPRFHT